MNVAKMIRAVLSVSLAFALLTGCGSSNENNTAPVEMFLNGSRQPWEYTLEEFKAMSDEQQLAFRNSFESLEAFYAWVDQEKSGDVKNPWEKPGAKQPIEYTLAEYEVLTQAQQQAFQNSFDSSEAFDSWLRNALYQTETDAVEIPWENGGKLPKDYTWAEFEALSVELQVAFQNSFDSFEAFDAWLQNSQYQAEIDAIELPWEEAGAKQPKDYTWEEFESLSAEQQMLFQNSFGSVESFDAWLQNAQHQVDIDVIDLPWEKPGAKQPKDYTWEEFEALNVDEQMAFQNSFVSQEAFDAWMQKAQKSNETHPWEKPGAKQPKDYTWAEFEALTADEQMAFQNSFATQDAFDAWLEKNMPQESGNSVDIPWQKPGAKQPEDYTWAEFEALSAELQMIFQNSFDSVEDFDAWMQRVNP